jgi:diguanylate cyclase (GGDEF)-like protein
MAELKNVLLLAADAVIYFAVLAGLFRARARLGIGTFFCALGVMHFLETYLASILYVGLPFGIETSPGSTVLFTGKLMVLLLVYIREDAVVVRQPIYGLLAGNLLLIALAFVMRHHTGVGFAAGRADFGFLEQMGGLMLWGTGILFLDCIMIILLYERSRAWLGERFFARLLLCGTAILTFDQLAFFLGLRALTGAPFSVLLGGWVAKMAAVVLYAGLAALYLHVCERPLKRGKSAPRVSDVFDKLTYRERYEDLLARTGRDALTGALDRGRLETRGRQAVEEATCHDRPVSLLLVDIDHFKSFNDRRGHAAGDNALRRIAREVMGTVRDGDLVFRFGGEEFVVVADGLGAAAALALGERIRRNVAGSGEGAAAGVTVSIGIATAGHDAASYDGLFEIADQRLYQAKALGRNCVIGPRLALDNLSEVAAPAL